MQEKNTLIVSLDVSTIKAAEKIVLDLSDTVEFYKIGYQLLFLGGVEFVKDLVRLKKKVFLDVKLLDIGNTVSRGIESILKLGVSMVTVHAYPQAMEAAVEAARGTSLCLLGVTVLTSMDNQDLANAGYAEGAQALVLRRALQAKDLGMGGIVCSAQEAKKNRHILGEDKIIVTPGIRLQSKSSSDQKRVATPRFAIKSGANHLVVGRPIIEAASPKKVVQEIFQEIAQSRVISR